jgi:hypothetical protein
MNIFALSTSPQEAASFHCDQHIHKMILESAQMLSNAARKFYPSLARGRVYEKAHENHPCTIWVSSSHSNMAWLCALATSLEEIRLDQGHNPHASMDIVSTVKDFLGSTVNPAEHTPFAEAMYPHIRIRQDLTTVQKYRLYYRKKHVEWKTNTGRGMTYKNRAVPEFLADLLAPSTIHA